MNPFLLAMEKQAKLLYHYSDKEYDELRTRRAQGVVTPEDMDKGIREAKYRHEVAPYYDHISFFTRPLPLRTVGEVYAGKGNRLWRKGGKVVEHVIDTDDLPEGTQYTMVETPEDVAMLPQWVDTDAGKRRYFAERAKARADRGDMGSGVDNLVAAARRYSRLAPAFRDAAKSYQEDEDWKRYATGVPHVMVYPVEGVVPLARAPERKTI